MLQTDLSNVKLPERDIILQTAMTFADLATSAYNGAKKLLTDPLMTPLKGEARLASSEIRHRIFKRRNRLTDKKDFAHFFFICERTNIDQGVIIDICASGV